MPFLVQSGRFGAGVAWTPALVTTAGWYDSSAAGDITSSGGAVSQLNDHGGARNLTQSNGAEKPTTGSVTKNSLNAIDFVSGANRLNAATASQWNYLHDGTVHLMGFVVRWDTGAGVLFSTNNTDGSAYGTYVYRTAAGAIWHRVNNGGGTFPVYNVTADALVADATWVVLTILADPSNGTPANRSEIQVNAGAAVKNNTASGTPAANDATSALILGASAASIDGPIAESVFITGADATSATRTNLISYLNTKWAVF